MMALALMDPIVPEAETPRTIRAEGRVRARFQASQCITRVAELYESGGYRLKFPRGPRCEAVLVNTGGGMVGGDELALTLKADEDAEIVLTTQSAEKLYRAEGASAEISISLKLDTRARIEWVPQETILFSGAQLSRNFNVDMARDASLLIFESTVFGRIAMGEVISDGMFRDHWRIRRDQKLIYADDVKLENNMAALLERKAIGNGACTVATCLYIAPDAEARLNEAREALRDAACECAASAWNGMMVVRFVSSDPVALRRSAVAFLNRFRNTDLPRVWQC
ncbi:MAG: urease accessory protein UreD [Hyphomicrobiales bacterium]